MVLKEFLQRQFEKRDNFKKLQQNFRDQKKVEEREKSSNERELERFQEEERQEKINQDLESFRKNQRDKMFKSNMLDTTNPLKGQNNILKGESMFSLKSDMLGGGNLFFK